MNTSLILFGRASTREKNQTIFQSRCSDIIAVMQFMNIFILKKTHTQ